VDGLALVAPGPSASFEIDPLDWLRTPREDPATRVAPAVLDLHLPSVCVMGSDDIESACRGLANVPAYRVVRLPGSHHFDGNFAAVGNAVAAFIQGVVRGVSASQGGSLASGRGIRH
jgi:type IV secretory pathway VirJ component